MPDDGIINLRLLKKELVLLSEVLAREQARVDAVDFATLGDDEAGELSNDIEILRGLRAMILRELQGIGGAE